MGFISAAFDFFGVQFKDLITRKFRMLQNSISLFFYGYVEDPKYYRFNQRNTPGLQILSFFTYDLVMILHIIIGKLGVLPSSCYNYHTCPKYEIDLLERRIPGQLRNQNFRFIKEKILIENILIEVMVLIRTTEDANPTRWTVFSVGNGEFYQDKFYEKFFFDLLNQLDSNALLFNYPGVHNSEGLPNAAMLVETYKGVLKYVEHKYKAKEVIGWGHSIGAAVQAEALKHYKFDPNTKYIFVKSRTFSELSSLATNVLGGFRLGGWVLCRVGWNFRPFVTSNENTSYPELILQTGNSLNQIIYDGLISPECSLAYHVKLAPNRKVLFIEAKHNDQIADVAPIVLVIKNMMSQVQRQNYPNPPSPISQVQFVIFASILIGLIIYFISPQDFFQPDTQAFT